MRKLLQMLKSLSVFYIEDNKLVAHVMFPLNCFNLCQQIIENGLRYFWSKWS